MNIYINEDGVEINQLEAEADFVASIELNGMRLNDGRLQLGFESETKSYGPLIDDWPDEIRAFDRVYSLELIERFPDKELVKDYKMDKKNKVPGWEWGVYM